MQLTSLPRHPAAHLVAPHRAGHARPPAWRTDDQAMLALDSRCAWPTHRLRWFLSLPHIGTR
jgi:hypothetical protein